VENAMMLHLGSGRSVPFSQVVALIDLHLQKTRDTQALIGITKAAGRLQSLGEPAKTLVLVQEKSGQCCYLSPLSVRTLVRRVHANFE
jgi:hypothetical protein